MAKNKHNKEALEWIASEQGKHLCGCGCGEELTLKWHHFFNGAPKWLRGHHSNKTGGAGSTIVKDWIEENQGKHFCACGCGLPVKIRQNHKYSGLPKYVQGHASRLPEIDFRIKFDSLLTKSDGCGCWEWTRSKDACGYGTLSWLGVYYRAHRLSYILNVGEIPEGKQVLHRCDNPACCRPDHLFLGDYDLNHLDKTVKGRAAKKLNKQAVLEIVDLLKGAVPRSVIAKKFSVGVGAIRKIAIGKTWAHLTGITPNDNPRWARSLNNGR